VSRVAKVVAVLAMTPCDLVGGFEYFPSLHGHLEDSLRGGGGSLLRTFEFVG